MTPTKKTERDASRSLGLTDSRVGYGRVGLLEGGGGRGGPVPIRDALRWKRGKRREVVRLFHRLAFSSIWSKVSNIFSY